MVFSLCVYVYFLLRSQMLIQIQILFSTFTNTFHLKWSGFIFGQKIITTCCCRADLAIWVNCVLCLRLNLLNQNQEPVECTPLLTNNSVDSFFLIPSIFTTISRFIRRNQHCTLEFGTLYCVHNCQLLTLSHDILSHSFSLSVSLSIFRPFLRLAQFSLFFSHIIVLDHSFVVFFIRSCSCLTLSHNFSNSNGFSHSFWLIFSPIIIRWLLRSLTLSNYRLFAFP